MGRGALPEREQANPCMAEKLAFNKNGRVRIAEVFWHMRAPEAGSVQLGR